MTPPPPAKASRTRQRLLVRGVNWLGDAVMSTPALLRLREAFPHTHIALLTREKLADLWQHHPALNDVLTIRPGEGVWSVGRRLRALQFDTALTLPNSPRSAIEIWLAGIPRRIGYRRPWRNWLLSEVIPTRPGCVKMRKRSTAEIKRLVAGQAARAVSPIVTSASAHQMHEYLQLATALGASAEPAAPQLFVTEEERRLTSAEWQKGKIEDYGGVSDFFWLGLNVGAEYGPAKRWPTEKWIDVANQVNERLNAEGRSFSWIFFGVEREYPLVNEVARKVKGTGINLCGKTSLRQLMAAISQCSILLTNDSGPMHVAAALGVPVVVPFGSTSPELTGPGLPEDARHRLLLSEAPCAPCFLRKCPIDFRCMQGIRVDRVVGAVMEVLGRATP